MVVSTSVERVFHHNFVVTVSTVQNHVAALTHRQRLWFKGRKQIIVFFFILNKRKEINYAMTTIRHSADRNCPM